MIKGAPINNKTQQPYSLYHLTPILFHQLSGAEWERSAMIKGGVRMRGTRTHPPAHVFNHLTTYPGQLQAAAAQVEAVDGSAGAPGPEDGRVEGVDHKLALPGVADQAGVEADGGQ